MTVDVSCDGKCVANFMLCKAFFDWLNRIWYTCTIDRTDQIKRRNHHQQQNERHFLPFFIKMTVSIEKEPAKEKKAIGRKKMAVNQSWMKGKDREPTLRYLTLYDRRHHPRPTWTDWQVDGARRQMVDDAPNNTALLVPPLRLGRHNRAKCNRRKRKELASENTHKVPTHTQPLCVCAPLWLPL